MSAFDLVREGGFTALDVAMMESFRSIWPESSENALHLAALSSWAVGMGHSCFDASLLEDWSGAGEPIVADLRTDDWPKAAFIGAPGSQLPIIVDGQRSWLHRYWQYEREVEQDLRLRAHAVPINTHATAVAEAIARLMPTAEQSVDWQRVAAAMALQAPLTVICGGPGTGKTYTALRVLALMARLADKPLRMALAAPTGKAAQRLSESVQAGLMALPLSEAERMALPANALTLHRLLGFRPQSVEPRRDASRPLDLDALVVDECSMVDLPLMAKLLRALKPECRLILLGDPDQLPAVENGAVLATLAATNLDNHFSGKTCRWLADVQVANLKPRRGLSTIADRIVRLERPRRFGGESGIARLVRAIRAGDEAQVFDALASSDDIHWSEKPWSTDAAMTRQTVKDAWKDLAVAESPRDALQMLTRYRILCALREGPRGVAGINHAVGNLLHGASATQLHVNGRPILINNNQHALGLYNGDVGIMLGEIAGAPLRAWFERRDGGLLQVLPTQLPPHQSAYAMTVHKAQGSEFDTVELVLPEAPHPLVTREWLYTAASRARDRLHVHASRDVIRAALGKRTRRINGLDFN